ncbi:MAG: type II toxin-antitoxin system HicB family antitoxin [Geobacteraceae bacterium]
MKTYRYVVVIEKDADGYYAYCPELQGCYTQGETYEETLESIKDAMQLHIEDRLEAGDELPQTGVVSLTSLEIAV